MDKVIFNKKVEKIGSCMPIVNKMYTLRKIVRTNIINIPKRQRQKVLYHR